MTAEPFTVPRRVHCEGAGTGGIHNPIRRRGFLKSGMALAVAAELGTGMAQGLVPAKPPSR